MKNNQNEEEYVDVVDQNDNVVSRMLRSENKNHLRDVRVVNGFILNSKGELWIPRRTAQKRAFPLCLDMSVGGYVMSGESYEEAFVRESKEELNLDIEKIGYKLLGYLSRKDDVSCFMKVYEIEMDETPDYNKDDFCEYFWIYPKDLLEKIKNGEKVKGDLLQLIKSFYIN
jgi:isopentenyldiphosphate isomerase